MNYLKLLPTVFFICISIGCSSESRKSKSVDSYPIIFGSIDNGFGFNIKIFGEVNADGIIEIKKDVNLHYWLVNQTDSDIFLLINGEPVKISNHSQVIHNADFDGITGGSRHSATGGSSTTGKYTLISGINAKRTGEKGASDDQIYSGVLDLVDIERTVKKEFPFEITVSAWLFGYVRNTGDRFTSESEIKLKIKIIE